MHELLKIAKYWAIEPDSLKSLCRLKDFQSLAFKSEARLNNTRSVLIRDGTAIIPIYGPITARSDLFTFFLGGTPLSDLAKDFQAALDNDQVKAILFDVDSPGGVALGPMEMAQAIFKARGKKPIWSYVGRNCSSAAYWLASATEKIIANPSALLGSIGVVTTIPVQEEPDSELFGPPVQHLHVERGHRIGSWRRNGGSGRRPAVQQPHFRYRAARRADPVGSG